MSAYSLSTALVLLLLAVSMAQQTSPLGCTSACLNGGKCQQVFNSDSYYCDCNGTDFTGSTCETATTSATSIPPSVAASIAASAPRAANSSTSSESDASEAVTSGCPVACQNGVCQQEFNSNAYYCECSSGFTGAACNVSSAVAPATPAISTTSCPVACEHGQCTQEFNSNAYFCQCKSGYSGVSCSYATAAATPSQAPPPPQSKSQSGCPVACVNGQCEQEFNSNAYHCQCRNGWTGLSCDTAVVSAAPAPATAQQATSSGSASHGTGTSIPGWAVFLVVLAIIAGLIGIGAVGVVVWQRRRRTTFVKFNDSTFEPQNVEVLPHNRSKEQPIGAEQQA